MEDGLWVEKCSLINRVAATSYYHADQLQALIKSGSADPYVKMGSSPDL